MNPESFDNFDDFTNALRHQKNVARRPFEAVKELSRGEDNRQIVNLMMAKGICMWLLEQEKV